MNSESAATEAAPRKVAPSPDGAIRLRGVTKIYERGGEQLRVLDGLDLDIEAGAFEALMGPSGSGKSTLLNLIAGLDRPSSGSVEGEDHARITTTRRRRS